MTDIDNAVAGRSVDDQMISYIHTLNNGEDTYQACAKLGALIYPLSFTDKTNSNNTYAVKTLYGSGGKLGVIPTMIPQGKDCYEYFIDEMGKTEEKLLHDINEMLDLSNMHHNFGVDINISD